jgi:hypothetical protein
MPLSKQDWDALKRLQDRYVDEYINSSNPHHTSGILCKQLYQLGLRDAYLEAEITQAVARRGIRQGSLAYNDQQLIRLLQQ